MQNQVGADSAYSFNVLINSEICISYGFVFLVLGVD